MAHVEKGRLIGYADLYGKIYWIWNPGTGKIVCASVVRFNEGPDLVLDDDVVDAEYEVVITDMTSEEEEEAAKAQKWFEMLHPDKTTRKVGFQGVEEQADQEIVERHNPQRLLTKPSTKQTAEAA